MGLLIELGFAVVGGLIETAQGNDPVNSGREQTRNNKSQKDNADKLFKDYPGIK